ncbi:MAG: hypothetical protein A3J06_03690 [Candidatus Moranbacteria bacterium RIFCSPLOWO2_02_FULL_48_19]|nr:MAG: hypothetical protein A3J06_03690 [Candidatus Moranbacteria bacterium RIFCSPLOWO2_02_FULL_48_19]OGI31242.1 MAG: hypothetical protein A3G09_03425 [Candidatus Moranbacteria bacterium RIFCSPLOWO2_12_FULL_48_12]
MVNSREVPGASNPAEVQGDNFERPTCFTTVEEAKRWLEENLLPRESATTSSEHEKPRGRESLDGAKSQARSELELFSTYVISHNLREEVRRKVALPPVQLHDGYKVDNVAPENINKAAEALRESSRQLPLDRALFEYVLAQLNDGSHELCREQVSAETGHDSNRAQIIFTEITRLKQTLEKRIIRFKELLLLAEDQAAWEASCKENAGILQRLRQLEAKSKARKPATNDGEFIEQVEVEREADAILKSKLVSPGNNDLQLYLYHHPDTPPDLRFSPEKR